MVRKYPDYLRMKNKTAIPTLRFPDFKDNWRKYKLGNLLLFFPTNSLGWDKLEYKNNGVFDIHYGLIHTTLPTLVSIDEASIPCIKPEFVPKKNNYCKEGDIIFTDASEDIEGIAKPIEIFQLNKKHVVSGLHTIHCRDKKSLTKKGFKGYLFCSSTFREQVKKTAQGIKVFSINSKTISEFNITIPCLQEQEKIIGCLSSIDIDIERVQTAIDALSLHKQALMQQLFPQRGDDTPGLRFTKKKRWKYKPLKTLAVHCTKKNVDSTEKNVLTNSAQFGVICQQEFFERDIVSQNNLKNYYIVEKGDYVYNPRVSIAAPVGPVSKNKNSRGVISPLYLVFRFNQEIDDFYVFYFQSQHWQIQLKKIANSGARFDRMSISTFDFFDIKVPDLPDEESEKISATLTSLDNLIDAYLKKYDLLIKHKRGLMQQLFPN